MGDEEGGIEVFDNFGGEPIQLDPKDPMTKIIALFEPDYQRYFKGVRYTRFGCFPLKSHAGDEFGLFLNRTERGDYYFVTPTKAKGEDAGEGKGEDGGSSFNKSIRSGVNPGFSFFWLSDIPLLASMLYNTEAGKFYRPWFISNKAMNALVQNGKDSFLDWEGIVPPTCLAIPNIYYKQNRNTAGAKKKEELEKIKSVNVYYLAQMRPYYSGEYGRFFTETIKREGDFVPILFEQLVANDIKRLHEKWGNHLLSEGMDPRKFAEACLRWNGEDDELVGQIKGLVMGPNEIANVKKSITRTTYDFNLTYQQVKRLINSMRKSINNENLLKELEGSHERVLEVMPTLNDLMEGIPPKGSIYGGHMDLMNDLRKWAIVTLITEKCMIPSVVHFFEDYRKKKSAEIGGNTAELSKLGRSLESRGLRSEEEKIHVDKFNTELHEHVGKKRIANTEKEQSKPKKIKS